jgi:hypothetical protein
MLRPRDVFVDRFCEGKAVKSFISILDHHRCTARTSTVRSRILMFFSVNECLPHVRRFQIGLPLSSRNRPIVNLYLFIVCILLFMNACMFVQQQILPSTAMSSSILLPTNTVTAVPTFTATPTPILTPSATSTETPRPDIAPTLPHAGVNFIYHGDRSKP